MAHLGTCIPEIIGFVVFDSTEVCQCAWCAGALKPLFYFIEPEFELWLSSNWSPARDFKGCCATNFEVFIGKHVASMCADAQKIFWKKQIINFRP